MKLPCLKTDAELLAKIGAREDNEEEISEVEERRILKYLDGIGARIKGKPFSKLELDEIGDDEECRSDEAEDAQVYKSSSEIEEEMPHYIGHRKRQKERFLNNDSSTFRDYEILELLLFQAIPRRDVKPLAKKLMAHFHNFENILNAEAESFSGFQGINDGILLTLKLCREVVNRLFKERIMKKHVLSSWAAVLNYLKFNMSCLKIEQFRLLFLNKQNALIADEVMATGTIDQTAVYPREIIKRILFYEAGAIIIVHNHPSGSTQPSNADLDITAKIVEACKLIGATVHDHIIIAQGEYYSFKSNMIL